ncbi:winged helix-turn-helix transcriptional regulator [Sphingomonas sp. CFBP 13728]|uniref:winged helix-turn-helix transcriptional regulator n=1 Tax=Sphingomonas sp. CFBP 13728 TaxID=2775294 RepID=UPI0018D6481F|nr:helix-turn-helix domain-containing protein [Sphingomonas sp. CFBP 13728]
MSDPDPNAYAAACPSRIVLDRVADKWTVLLLGILSKRPTRFNQLRREIEGLSQKVLSQTLKNLERDGLVIREAFATVPVTVEYSITPLGATLAEKMEALLHWAEGNVGQVLEAQRRYDKAQTATM